MEEDRTLEEQDSIDIAVVGMSGRFPGAGSVDGFWQNLRAGRESVTFFSEEELREAGVDPTDLADADYVRAAPVLDRPDLFDAPFFGYSPREAEIMDPQQRLFLECSWEVLESAGYDAERYDGAIGVCAGASRNMYLLFSPHLADYSRNDLATVIGSDSNFLATRVSYKLNLTGPSATVQTGCSTSLVAIHMACQSLLNAECDMVIAGGVSVRVPHRAGYLYRRGGILSPDGHCRAFDAKGEGTIFGSGVGVVLLKRLTDAIHDGDHVRAVIKGSAINNDGHTKVDYTAPSVDGQAKAITEALATADVPARTISYIETHGTGTNLGDPIEVAALTRAFRNYTDDTGFCAIGSVKTNIGHLDVAAGAAGFIKAVLSLEHGEIPPSLHFEEPNPQIDFAASPFYVNAQLAEWPANGGPRRAGVSSFGVGGTNAHIILEQAPELQASGDSRPSQLVVLSARSGSALEAAAQSLASHLKEHPEVNLADVAHTLQSGRKEFGQRGALVCGDVDHAVASLEALKPGDTASGSAGPADRDTVFIFSGQGSQYASAGLGLYEKEPVFREHVDRCAETLKPDLGFDIRDVMYPGAADPQEAADRLRQTYITQPALFTIEYSLAQLWMSWGVRPQAMVGHSIGEYVAACLAGVFSFEEALALVAARGRLMQDLPGGSMLAVFLAEADVRPYLDESISLAVINGPSLCVLSGNDEAVAALKERLSAEQITCRRVNTSHAFHSGMMEPILEGFTERVSQVSLSSPRIPFVSNVTGTWITTEEATDPAYWARHLRQTVRFSDCLQELLKEPNRVLLEVGPGTTFRDLAMSHPDRKLEHAVLASTRHPKQEGSDVAFILETLGQLWVAGVTVDWARFHQGEDRHRVPLPAYPFERQSYWSAAQKPALVPVSPAAGEPTAPGAAVHSAVEAGQDREAVGDESGADIERALADIWLRILGVRNPATAANFFDLGGNSLMAVSLFAQIERALGKRLPVSSLIEAPTFGQLAELIGDEDRADPWKSLTRMRSGESGPALFLIHGGGGNVLTFYRLVQHLDIEQPIYGLQSQGLDGQHPFHTRIEDMAAHYIRDIQTVQPEGPYLLTGFCMGGSVGLEMALQLQEQGHEVPLLAFLETFNFGKTPRKSLAESVYFYLQKIEFNWGRLRSEERAFLKRRFDIIRERLALWNEIAGNKLGRNHSGGGGQHLRLHRLERSNDDAALSYLPESVFRGTLTQFVGAKEYKFNKRPEFSWDGAATDGVRVHELPVYHRQMLTEPYVRSLADQLKASIAAALEAPRTAG